MKFGGFWLKPHFNSRFNFKKSTNSGSYQNSRSIAVLHVLITSKVTRKQVLKFQILNASLVVHAPLRVHSGVDVFCCIALKTNLYTLIVGSDF